MSSPRVAIVGAAGFIGKFTARAASDLGFETTLITSHDGSRLADTGYWKSISPTHVVWLASKVTPSVAHDNKALVQQELLEFENALKALRGVDPHFVFASSGGTVYTGGVLPYSESHEANGANEYGKLKLTLENALSVEGIAHTVLRISNAYGFGQRLDRGQGVISAWINEILNNKPISVFGSLENTRDFIYIEDVVSAITTVIESSDSTGIFNIGSGLGVELSTVIQELRVISGEDFSVREFPGRTVDRKAIWLDIGKAKQNLGWMPKTSLRQGLEKTWTMAKNNMK